MTGLVVVDTSFWIDFERRSAPPNEAAWLEEQLQEGSVVMSQFVWLELVVGMRSSAERQVLADLRAVCRWAPLNETDGDEAERIESVLRPKGVHLPASDLLLFATANKLNARILHHDRDFKRATAVREFAHLEIGWSRLGS
jgi:predicted nucleic acid-binding protein